MSQEYPKWHPQRHKNKPEKKAESPGWFNIKLKKKPTYRYAVGTEERDPETNKTLTFVASVVCFLNWIVAICIPFAYWNSASKEGYPWDPHIIFAVYSFVVVLFELCYAFILYPKTLFSFCNYEVLCGCGWIFRVIYHLFIGLLSRADIYTDGTFVVVAYHTPDSNLFIPALVMYILGVVVCQFLCEGDIILMRLREEATDRGTQDILFRHGGLDLIEHVRRSGGNTAFNFYVAACRLCCEDIAQTVIQMMFLLEPHGSNENKYLIMTSIIIGILLSIFKCCSTLCSCLEEHLP